jgi:hypothetical protein
MAWISPPTFVSGAVLTAAQLNILSGNLNETAAAKATTQGQFFVATAANQLAPRLPVQTSANITESTASTTFADLTTFGPTADTTTGLWALVCMQAMVQPGTSGASGQIGIEVTGATTIAASTIYLSLTAAAVNQQVTCAGVRTIVGLTSGLNSFTMKYAVTGGTVQFGRRFLSIVPF